MAAHDPLAQSQGQIFLWSEVSVSKPIDLHTAAALGDFDCVRTLIREGADINRVNKGGWTALTYACYVGHDNIVNMLLDDANADVNGQGTDGTSPLMWAAACGNESVAYFLLAKGCLLELRDKQGQTALLHAVTKGHQSIVKLLLEHGAEREARNPGTGNTPLIEAAAQGFESIVQTLIEFGADIDATNKQSQTASAVASCADPPRMAVIHLLDNARNPRTTASDLREEAGLGLGFQSSPAASPIPSEGNGVSDIRSGPTALLQFVGASGSPSPASGNADELGEFLTCLGLQKYLELFRKEEVDFPTLITMTEADLKAIGLTLFGPRRKIASAIKRWHEQHAGSDLDLVTMQMQRLTPQ